MRLVDAINLLSRQRVAQIFNLLYRRIAFGRAPASPELSEILHRLADCKSAIQQIENLRYGYEMSGLSLTSFPLRNQRPDESCAR